MKKQPRILFVLAGLASILATTGCTASNKGYTPGTPVKVGLICIHNSSSTYDKNFIDSMDRAVANLGDRVAGGAAIVKTDVDESIDCYDAAKDLVKQGCNVVIADSFGHEEFLLTAAEEFPDVVFAHATGTSAATAGLKNFHNAFASIYEGRYLAGYVAGLKLADMEAAGELKSSNYDENGNIKLGYVGAYPYAEVISGYTSWFLGVKEVVPNVVMNVTFTKSWYDPNAEKTGAHSLIDGGAAIISQHADSMGAPGECETMGVPNVTYNIPLAVECPNTYLAYSKIDWAPYYEALINAVYDGKAIEGEVNNNYTGTIGTGSVIYDAPNATYKAAAEKVKAELIAGTRRVFDCSKFTVGGQHLTSYLADVIPDQAYAKDTEAIVTKGGITYFDESAHRSAPYFDIDIDGITKLNS